MKIGTTVRALLNRVKQTAKSSWIRIRRPVKVVATLYLILRFPRFAVIAFVVGVSGWMITWMSTIIALQLILKSLQMGNRK